MNILLFFLPEMQLDLCCAVLVGRFLALNWNFFSILFIFSFIFPRGCECFLLDLTTFNWRNLQVKTPQPPGSPTLGIFWDMGEFFSLYLTQVPGLGSSLGLDL